jgi:prevent-host-death family protein
MNKLTHIPISEAEGQLGELARHAEAGDDVILTRHGQPAARIVPYKRKLTPEERGAVIDRIRREAAAKATPGPCAARSQDFLYGDDGMPA